MTFPNWISTNHAPDTSGGMIECASRTQRATDIVPPGLILVEQFTLGNPENLYEVERKIIERAVLKRQQEFAAGRACARAALARLGIDDFPLLANSDRSPRWPKGIVGSITHTDGYCAAIVGPAAELASVGLDAEVVGKIDRAMWQLLFTEKEQTWLAGLTQAQQSFMATLLFSAKEAFFKYQYPIRHTWLEFTDVSAAVGNGQSIEMNTHATMPELKVLTPYGKYGYLHERNIVITVISSGARGGRRAQWPHRHDVSAPTTVGPT